MADSQCPKCHKPALAEHAGSITSYFFQGNYCQCNSKASKSDSAASKKASAKSNVKVCLNCGKAKPENRRAGSFSAFLFKELRCSCSGATPAKSRDVRGMKSTSRQTAERKSFTKKLQLTAFKNSSARTGDLLTPGTTIGGVFQILSVIGQGGMGAVYLANHLGLQRQFALKMLLPELVNEQTWQRFKFEARTIAALNHPSIVKVYDLGVHENTSPYYSMDYVKGETLETLLLDGALPLPRVLNLFIEILDGLAYAHRNGVIHRDLKPANIIITSHDGSSVKILDFGIAKLLDSPVHNQNLTMAGEIFGSPFYMSPEQASGKSVDARTDIYSIGCALFEALTTFVPFDGANSIEIITSHQNDDAPYMKDVAPSLSLPDSIEYVAAKCLAKLPDDRYQSAKELSLDLLRIQEGKNLTRFPHLAKQHRNFTGEALPEHSNETIYDETEKGNSPFWYLAAGVGFLLLALVAFVIASNAPAALVWTARQMELVHPAAPSVSHVFLTSLKPSIKADTSPADTSPADTSPADTSPAVAHFLKTRTGPYLRVINVSGEKLKYFEFAKNFSIGTLTFMKGGRLLSKIAQGRIDLTGCSSISLYADETVAKYPDLLKPFGPTDLELLEIGSYDAPNQALVRNMARLTGLKSLALKGEGFDHTALLDSSQFPSLKSLSLSQVEVFRLQRNSLIPRLSFVSISRTGPASTTLLCKSLQHSKHLKELSISGCELSSANMKIVAQIPSLTTLTLAGRSATSSALSPLVKSENLNSLLFSNIPEDFSDIKADSKQFFAVLKKLKKIKSLIIPYDLLSAPEIKELQHQLPDTKIIEHG